jgi:hypothetical protein
MRRPIQYWFEITTTPMGGAPVEVREQWVGVVLPIRRPRPVEGPEPWVGREIGTRQPVAVADGVVVEADDAVRSLRLFDRPDAAGWWETFLGTSRVPALGFRWGEGRWLPEGIVVSWYPFLDGFDG